MNSAIRKSIYKRIIGGEFVTDSGIRIPIDTRELERRITYQYPQFPGINPANFTEFDSSLKSPILDISKLTEKHGNPEDNILETHRRIIGNEYISPELGGLPIPVRIKSWEGPAYHHNLLVKNGVVLRANQT